MVGGAPDQRLRRRQRLIRSADFQDAYRQNSKFVGRLLVMYVRKGDQAALRLGVVTGRKVGNAVTRNRARRRMREAYRRIRHQLTGAVDIVLVARQAMARAGWPDVQTELWELCRRAGLSGLEANS